MNELKNSLLNCFRNPVSFNSFGSNKWDSILENNKLRIVPFRSNTILYEENYYCNSPINNYTFIDQNEDQFCLLKVYLHREYLMIYPPFFSENYNYFDAITVNKKIIKILKNIDIKIQILHIPFSNSLIDFFRIGLIEKIEIPTRIDMFINLKLNIDQIWTSLRKSYKSLINGEKKSVKVLSDYNHKIWEECKRLHFKVSKRKTRSDKTWDLQYESIRLQESKVFYIKENKKIIAFALFSFDIKTAYYGVAVNDRALFKKMNLSHIILWNAILYFKNHNIEFLYMGDNMPNNYLEDKKLRSINDFKMGFANFFKIN